MAGLGRKTFVATEVLSAANVNGYLMDQSVMVFAGTAARSSAIGTAVSEGMVSYLSDTDALEVYNGTSWGAVSSSSSGNAIINGAFDIWQRGTSNTSTTNGYTAPDRWLFNASGSHTISRQTTGVPSGSQYCMRVLANGSQTVNSIQFMETSQALQFAGKTITATIKVRRNASLTQNISLSIDKTPTVDAGIGAAWTSIGAYTILNSSMPTGTTSADWFTASITVSVPNDGTANSLRLAIYSGTIPAGGYYEVAEVQLEAGSVATPFKRNAPSIQAELAACMRYFQRRKVGGANYGLGMPIAWRSSTAGVSTVSFQTAMRTSPSVSFGGDLNGFYGNSSALITALSPIYGGGSDAGYLGGDTNINVSSGPSNGQAGWMQAGGTGSAFVEFSSEL